MSPTLEDSRFVRRDDSVTNSSSSSSFEGSTSVTVHAPFPTSEHASFTPFPTSPTSSSDSTSSSSGSIASLDPTFSSNAALSSSTTSTSSFSITTPSSSSTSSPSSSISQLADTVFTTSFSFPSFPATPSASPTATSHSPISPISVTTAVTPQSFPTEAPSSSSDSAASTAAPTTLAIVSSSTSFTSPTSSASISGKTSGALAASSSGFWANKSAVAGTFATVAIVGLAIILGAFLCIQRKRRRSHFRSNSYSEKFIVADPRPYSSSSGNNSQDLSHEPTDAFANRDPAYYPMDDPFASSAQQTLYSGNASLPEITYSYAQDVNNQYPYYGDEANSLPLPSSGTRSAAPTTVGLRNPFEPPVVPVQNPFEPVQALPNPFEPGVSAASTAHTVNERNSAAYPPSLDDSFYSASIDERAI